MQHRSAEVRQDLVMLRARDALVSGADGAHQRHARLGKSMGTRLPKCSSPSFAQRVKEAVRAEIRDALLPLVGLTAALSDCIQGYDEKIEELGREKYGHTALLRQVKGVGPITALVLGPFGPDTDLRRYGLRLCERGGKNAKKRAAIAVARKLAVLLHRLWVSGEVYEPLRPALSAPMAAAA